MCNTLYDESCVPDNTCAQDADAVEGKCMALATTPVGCDANSSSGVSCSLFIDTRIIIKIVTIYSPLYHPLCILYISYTVS